MRHASIPPVLLGLAMTGGCLVPEGSDFLGSALDSQLVAIVARHASEEKHASGELRTTQVAGKSLERKLSPYDRVETDQIAKIEIQQVVGNEDHDFKVLLAPDLVSGGTAQGWVVGNDDAKNPPCFRLDEGWLFLWEELPMSTTDWVSTAGDGTSYIVQLVSPFVQRVIFLGSAGDKVTVKCLSGSSTQVIDDLGTDDEGMYVDVIMGMAGCQVLTPKNVKDSSDDTPDPGDMEIEQFVAKAKAIGRAGGWPG